MDNIYFYIIIFIFISIFSFAFFIILKYSKKGKISKERKDFFNKQLKKIKSYNSNKEKIIDYDKLYHKILQELGYTGTFGDILKKEPNEIGDLQLVWDLHKMRNKLVHDFDLFTDSTLKKKSLSYEKEIIFLIN